MPSGNKQKKQNKKILKAVTDEQRKWNGESGMSTCAGGNLSVSLYECVNYGGTEMHNTTNKTKNEIKKE